MYKATVCLTGFRATFVILLVLSYLLRESPLCAIATLFEMRCKNRCYRLKNSNIAEHRTLFLLLYFCCNKFLSKIIVIIHLVVRSEQLVSSPIWYIITACFYKLTETLKDNRGWDNFEKNFA